MSFDTTPFAVKHRKSYETTDGKVFKHRKSAEAHQSKLNFQYWFNHCEVKMHLTDDHKLVGELLAYWMFEHKDILKAFMEHHLIKQAELINRYRDRCEKVKAKDGEECEKAKEERELKCSFHLSHTADPKPMSEDQMKAAVSAICGVFSKDWRLTWS